MTWEQMGKYLLNFIMLMKVVYLITPLTVDHITLWIFMIGFLVAEILVKTGAN